MRTTKLHDNPCKNAGNFSGNFRRLSVLLGLVLFAFFLLASCSTTKKLKESEILYVGVKKMKIEAPAKVKLNGTQKSAASAPLSVKPNNPLYSPYVRSPFPIGLWVYNWNIKKEKGFKWWVYRKLAKK